MTSQEWIRIPSGVPRGSVLAQIMFLIYKNDIVQEIDSYSSLLPDDAKVMNEES